MHRSGRVFGSAAFFGVQRGPVLKGRRLVNFANPLLRMLSGFQGFCCRSLAHGMATTWVRDHHLDFRTCSIFSVKRRVGEEMRGNLIGTWGFQCWDLAQEPRQDHHPDKKKQRPAGNVVGAPAKPAPRSQKGHPPEAENNLGFFLRGPGYCLAGAWGRVRLASLRSGVRVSGLVGVQRTLF